MDVERKAAKNFPTKLPESPYFIAVTGTMRNMTPAVSRRMQPMQTSATVV
jgi:hypothetical protein